MAETLKQAVDLSERGLVEVPLAAPAPVIRFAGVDQAFAASDGSVVQALRDVSFSIGRHEFVSVLGPSGCGKSTLLRIIAGLVRPTGGRAEIHGRAIDGPRDEIGIVFQRPTLLPWLRVLQNVTFPMRHKHGRVSPQDTARAQQLLGLVGLGEFARKRPDELSGGMQQRVAIARAMLHDPDILLMDEPFSALDALTRDEMAFELLRIWGERPKTVLFVTHSIPEALLLADRVLMMSSRPGAIRETLAVELPRPRSMETMGLPLFNELATYIRSRLFARA